jgi:hypothetical protein
MQLAARPHVTAGIALAGAAAIAVSPIAPPLPDIHLPNPARVAASVELAAATLAATPPSYAQVIQEAVANAQALLNTITANPTPILSKIGQNQAITIQNLMTALQTLGGAISTQLTTTVPTLLQGASNDLASGNVEGATNNVLSAILATVFPITGFIPAVSAALTQPLTNLVAAINAVQAGGVTSPLAMAVTGLLGPALSGAGAFGVAVDNVGSAITAGDPQAALNAVVNGPATIVDGVLNGGFGPDLSSLAGLGGLGITVVAGGLLSGGLAITGTSPVTIQLPGTINSLEALATAFAKALTPPKVTAMAALTSSTLAAPAALPAAASKAFTLSTAPTVKVAAPAGDTANPTKGDTADATKGNTAESTTGKADDTSSDTGASAGTSPKPGTPTSGPKHRAPTGNGANSTAAGSHDQGTNGSTGSHSTATKAAKHAKK